MWNLSISHDERPKPWCGDCIYLDDMQIGQTRYIDQYEFVNIDNEWHVRCNALTSPVRRGVHNTEIQREEDHILVRDDIIKGHAILAESYIRVAWRPYTRDEKIDILWKERQGL